MLLSLHNPSGLLLGSADTATLTINDDDNPPTVQWESSSYTVGESASSIVVTASLSAPSAQTVTVEYDTVESTATQGSDYTHTSGTLTFSPAEIRKSFPISINEDSLSETDESFNVRLSNPTNATVGFIDQTVVTIQDNEAPTVSFELVNISENENVSGGNASVKVVLNRALPSGTASVTVVSSAGSATTAADYSDINLIIPFGVGETEKIVQIPFVNDNLDEGDETILLALSNPTGILAGDNMTSTLTILDDDPSPTISFEAATVDVAENHGAGKVVVDVVLNVASTQVIQAAFSTNRWVGNTRRRLYIG